MVVLLPWVEPLPFEVARALAEANVSVLDLQEMRLQAFPSDGHPNADDHKRISYGFKKSFVASLVEKLGRE